MPVDSRLALFVSLVLLLIDCSIASAREIDFQRDVRPILSETCFHCHGPDAATREADLRLDHPDSALEVIRPGDPQASELIRRITAEDANERMPPAESRKSLTASQREILTRWVEQGADYQVHWSFRPLQSTAPPRGDSTWPRQPIDDFVLARLKQAGLQPSPPASRETLIRRITFDLTGLPPTPQEVDDFVADPAPLAAERLIDRLMQSPHYGQHMALPWLEASRYADTDGYQNDRYRYQHVWRDWVIDAFNTNMPYDQFIIEQLAGDMLPEATLRQQIATGFGRNHRINSEDGSIPEEWRTEYVVDRVDTFGTVFLGLTIGCARCHDHKYDPISQKEYYQLFAYFNNVAEWGVGPNNGNSPPFVEVPASWPNLSPAEDQLQIPEPVKLHDARKQAGNGLQRPQAGSPSSVMVMHELDQPRATYLLRRGQYNLPDRSEQLVPAVPEAFNPQSADPANRLELARWLVDHRHPLTARVAVNRLWQQFFGVGLVASSENFGSQGSPPSHPELLDYLAGELIRQDWDLRAIEKMILLSATYQQSSAITPQLAEHDPENHLLARGPRVRMSAFTIRDAVLSASGLLVDRIGGPPVKPYMPPKIWSAISNNKYQQDSGDNLFRRSLYTYWRRTIPPPTMMNFNAAAREVCTVRTSATNTPLQALTLLNNTTFVEAARVMAERMYREAGNQPSAQIEYGFRLMCARRPQPAELELLRRSYQQFLQQYQADPESAVKLISVGQAPCNRSLPAPTHAALAMTASLIMNLDEAITKE